MVSLTRSGNSRITLKRLAESKEDLHESAYFVRLDLCLLEVALNLIGGFRVVGSLLEGLFVDGTVLKRLTKVILLLFETSSHGALALLAEDW